MFKALLAGFRNNDWSIKVKLLTITTVLIVGSVMVVSLLSFNRYTIDFQDQSAQRVQQIIEQLSYNIESYLDDLFRLSRAPLYDTEVMRVLEAGQPATELAKLEKRRMIEGYLDNLMIIPRKDILSVYILSDEIYRGGRYSAGVDNTVKYQDFAWYQQALKTEDMVFVPVHMEQLISSPRFKIFSVVKSIRNIKDNSEIIGVIKVDANFTGIETLCHKVDMGKEGGIFIIDQNDTVIYSSIQKAPLADLYQLVRNSSNTKPYITTRLDGKQYLLNAVTIPNANWTVVALNSIDELNQSALQTRDITYLLAFASSLLAIVVLWIFTNSFLNPLMTIIHLMKEVKGGNLQVEFPEQRRDEIGYLGSSFNTMISRINAMMKENTALVTEVYEAKILQKEAQMNALNSQIRPHFIYNTLNMISLMIQVNKNEDAIDNINKLSDLMRGMAHIDKEIKLETEIGLLNAYLGIQASRYRGRLEYQIAIDPQLNNLIIPALIFQPVVENSIVHGCEKRKEKTTLRIYSTLTANCLTFIIEDDAGGIDPAELAKLRERLAGQGNEDALAQQAPGKGSGIGLTNVNKRIRIKYGDAYGLVIESEKGAGTRVSIHLPRPQ